MALRGELVLTLADIAAQLGGDVLGDAETRVSGVATLASAGEGDIAFLANPKYRNQLQGTKASAVILALDAAEAFPGPRIVTANPYAYYARVATMLYPAKTRFSGVHPTAVVESPVPASAAIGANVVIGRGVRLGEGVVIHPGCVIGDDVSIGDGTTLFSNVTINDGSRIGKRNILHPGVVIGADGFGFAPDGQDWIRIPQIGAVVIGDDVDIGANTTIDRGALDDTVIGDGCKLDNQVQIGHNCQVGANSVIAGCAGIAGSTTFGEHCIIGGAAMVAGHLTIAAGSIVSGGSSVMKSLPKSGVYTSVFPLDTHEDWVRNASHIRRLSKMADRISELEKKLKEVEIKD